MAEAKWLGVLSTTEPRNDVGIIKVRQGNINSEIAEFQIVQNNKPYDLTGLTVYFCASFGLNLVEKPAVVVNATGGRIQYTFDDDSMQAVGRQKGYFSIKKAESKIDSTQEFEYQVESSLMTRSIDGKSYIYKLSTLIKVLDDFIKNGQNNFNVWFESVKEILYGVDPGGSILRELIEARKNSSGNIFASLKARLDKNEDDTAAQLAQTTLLVEEVEELQPFIDTGLNIILKKGGLYNINQTIRPKSNQKINLNGSTLLWKGTPYSHEEGLMIFNLDGLENVEIKNGIVDGNRANRPDNSQGISCIQGVAAKNCHIHHIKFVGYGGSENYYRESGIGIHFEANDDPDYVISSVIGESYGNVVEKCTFDDIYAAFGCRFLSTWTNLSATNECYNNIFRYNVVKNSGKSGHEMAGATTHSCISTNNVIENALVDGIDIDKGAYRCTVSHCVIKKVGDGKVETQYGGISVAGLSAQAGIENKVLYNVIEDVNVAAINVQGASKTLIQGNTILHSGTYGIYVDKTPSTRVTNSDHCIIKDNTIINTNFRAIYVTQASGTIIQSNEIIDVYGRGIDTNNCNQTSIEGNFIQHTPKSQTDFSIYSLAGYTISIKNNTIDVLGTTQNNQSIYIAQSTNVDASGNTIKGNSNTTYGIRVDGTSSYVTITNNHVRNILGAHGIVLDIGSSKLIVMSNMSAVANGSGDASSVVQSNITP